MSTAIVVGSMKLSPKSRSIRLESTFGTGPLSARSRSRLSAEKKLKEAPNELHHYMPEKAY